MIQASPLACEHLPKDAYCRRFEAATLRKVADVARQAAIDLNNAAVPASEIAWHEVQRQVSGLESLASTLNEWARQADKH